MVDPRIPSAGWDRIPDEDEDEGRAAPLGSGSSGSAAPRGQGASGSAGAPGVPGTPGSPSAPSAPSGPLPLTDAEQRTLARLALQAASDLVQTACLWPDAAVFISLTTGPIFDRIEGALVMLRAAPAELRDRALALQREIDTCHRALLLSVLYKLQGRVRTARDQAERAGRHVRANDLLGAALIGAQRGLRHFDPDGVDPLWNPVRNWALKGLGEDALNSGPLRVTESAIEAARGVKAGRVDPNSQRGRDTSSIWGGRDAMRDSLEAEIAELTSGGDDPSAAIDGARALQRAMAWLADVDPLAHEAVREELGFDAPDQIGEDAPNIGAGAKSPPAGHTNGANLSRKNRAALRKSALARGMAWLRLRMRGAREALTVARAGAEGFEELKADPDEDGPERRRRLLEERLLRLEDRARRELPRFRPAPSAPPTQVM